VLVNVFLTSTTVVPNHFAEGSQIQIYQYHFIKPQKNLPQVNRHVFFALMKSVTQNIRGATE